MRMGCVWGSGRVNLRLYVVSPIPTPAELFYADYVDRPHETPKADRDRERPLAAHAASASSARARLAREEQFRSRRGARDLRAHRRGTRHRDLRAVEVPLSHRADRDRLGGLARQRARRRDTEPAGDERSDI